MSFYKNKHILLGFCALLVMVSISTIAAADTINLDDCDVCHYSIPVQHEAVNHNSNSYCIGCHGSDLTVHIGECTTCHGIDASNPLPTNTRCESCHGADVRGIHISFYDNHASSTEDCITCHGTDLPTVHLNNQNGCFVCHESEIFINEKTADCYSCHPDPNIGFHINMSDKHNSTSYCTDCHQDSYLPDLHEEIALTNGMTNCTICHANTDKNINTDTATSDCTTCHGLQLPTQHVNESTKHTSSTLTNDCIVCHSTNYLPTLHGDLGKGYDCNTCHNNVNTSRVDWDTVNSSCDTCHTIHDDVDELHNIMADSICMPCHENSAGGSTDIRIIHNNDCAKCHDNDNVVFTGVTDCTDCHDKPDDYHTQINDAHSSDYTGCCHGNELLNIHIDNNYRYNSDNRNDCNICHDNPAQINITIATSDCRSCHIDQNVGYHSWGNRDSRSSYGR